MKIKIDWEAYQTSNQQELLRQLAKDLKGEQAIANEGKFVNEVIQREQIASTVVANNLAIPHVCSENILQAQIVVLKLPAPLTSWQGYEGIDRLILAIVPEKLDFADQQKCKQFFSNLGKPKVLNLFSHGSQKEIREYLSEKR